MEAYVGKLEIVEVEITDQRRVHQHEYQSRRERFHHLPTIGVEDQLKPGLWVVLNHTGGDNKIFKAAKLIEKQTPQHVQPVWIY
jgi:hypothetical protein